MVRRLRLGSGLVLFAYLLTHFLNHSLGLVSLDALEAGRAAFLWLWRGPPGTVLLYGSLLIHGGLAFWSLYQRRRLAMPPWEAAQLILGLAIPPLLAIHVLGTRLAFQMFELRDSYAYILLVYFLFDPLRGLQQLAVMTVAWVHGCVGLHFWLRLRTGYRRTIALVYAAAVLVPVVALLGVLVAGRDVLRLAADPAWLESALARTNLPDQAGVALIHRLEVGFLIGFAGVLALVLALRLLRAWWERRHGIVNLVYPDERRVVVVAGTSILEASRGAGIPHAAVCGGRGRCSTCRVRVGRGLDELPQPSEEETKVLARVGAAPNVRLACQTRPSADVEVTPLLPAAATPREARARPGYMQGQEREIAVLFADLRNFTALSEKKLPYDVVFVLNRYFAAMGMAVEEAGGRVDKFIGDGVMALFGVESRIEQGCGDSLSAARRMAERLMEINVALKGDLDQPLRIGIGIHTGHVIVGEMGYGRATSVTAIGDTVNTASRLEAMTKELNAQLVLSERVARRAGVDLGDFARQEIEVRGRSEPLAVRVVPNALKLPVAADRGPEAESRAARRGRRGRRRVEDGEGS